MKRFATKKPKEEERMEYRSLNYKNYDDQQSDEHGQVIIHTGVYFWRDGTKHLSPERTIITCQERNSMSKILTEYEVSDYISHYGSKEVDEYGELIIYTGVFKWQDGSFRLEPELLNFLEEEMEDSRVQFLCT